MSTCAPRGAQESGTSPPYMAGGGHLPTVPGVNVFAPDHPRCRPKGAGTDRLLKLAHDLLQNAVDVDLGQEAGA